MKTFEDLDPVDWVTARNECNPSDVLDSLYEQIQQDVEIARQEKAVPDIEKIDVKMEVYGDGERKIEVMKPRSLHEDERKGGIKIVTGTNSLIVSYLFRNEQKLKIDILYDRDKALCLLRIDGRSMRLWQVSQEILGDLFFGGLEIPHPDGKGEIVNDVVELE